MTVAAYRYRDLASRLRCRCFREVERILETAPQALLRPVTHGSIIRYMLFLRTNKVHAVWGQRQLCTSGMSAPCSVI